MSTSFYTLSARSLQGKEIPMETYRGKIVLVVNTASKCGFTPQYAGLEKLYQDYRERGLVVLGFPCNQFGNQEPGDEQSIASECLVNYGVTFPMFAKTNVNGPDAHPIFTYLKSRLRGLLGGRIKWNFTKFLLDEQGTPVKRFGPTVKPEAIDRYLQKHVFQPNTASKD